MNSTQRPPGSRDGDVPPAPATFEAISLAFAAWARCHKELIQLKARLQALPSGGDASDPEAKALLRQIAEQEEKSRRLLNEAQALLGSRGNGGNA